MYEKNHIKEDRRRNSYYLEDYIYVKNFKTKLSVTIVVMMFMVLDIFQTINYNFIFPTSVVQFLSVYITPYLIPWIIILIGYTILSTALYGRRYALSQKRLKIYNKLLKQLDAYEQKKGNEERAVYETE